VIKSKLSDEELDAIIDTTNKLKTLQAAEDPPEARATIPSLELQDLKREVAEYPIAVSKNENDSGVTVLRHELGSTSGIAYVNLGVDVSGLSLDDAAILPLFTRMLMEVGAGEYDQVALSRRIGTHTGGINVNLMTTAVLPEGGDQSTVISGNHMQTKLIMKGKATSDKTEELFSLMNLILTDAQLDSKTRVIEILKEKKSRMESGISGRYVENVQPWLSAQTPNNSQFSSFLNSGHSVANTRMKARYRVGGYIDELLGGITQLETIRETLKQAENDWPALLARLEKIRNTILNSKTCRSGMFLDITADATVFEKIQPSVGEFLKVLPGDADGDNLPNFYKEEHPWTAPAKERMAEMAPIKDEGFVVSTQVSYVGKAGLVYADGETIDGSAQVVARFLRTGYLWDYVRVMGGAYGGFCTFSPYSGFFSFLSYRDPNLAKTLDVYDGAADAVIAAAEQLANDPDGLAAAIIGTIGDMDGSLSPDQKGYTSLQRWLVNESAEYRQKYRDEILNTKASDFQSFGERLKALQQPSVAVVSSLAAFEAAAKAGKEMKLKTIL
jgi:Zn-dependent M16 (insulinase) family peptidase